MYQERQHGRAVPVLSAERLLTYLILFLLLIFAVSVAVTFTPHKYRTAAAVAAAFLTGGFFIYLVYEYALTVSAYIKRNGGTSVMARLYRTNAKTRTLVNNSFTAVYAILFGIYEYSLSFVEQTMFFLSVAVVYIILGIAKVSLVTHNGVIEKQQGRINKILGVFFALIAVSVFGITILVNALEGTFSHPGLTIYGIATYSFFVFVTTIKASIQSIKRKDSFAHTFIRIKQVNALYTVFTLTVSMLVSFSEDPAFAKVMTLSVGFSVSLLLLIDAVYVFILGIKTPPANAKDRPAA